MTPPAVRNVVEVVRKRVFHSPDFNHLPAWDLRRVRATRRTVIDCAAASPLAVSSVSTTGLAAGKDRHTMAQLAARGTPRRHPTIWELYLPRVRQRVSLAEPARATGARRLQISGAVCCIAGPGRTGACGCKTCVRHHGTESPVHKIAIDGRQRPPRPASGRVSPTLRVRCSALLCRAAILILLR